MYKRQVFCSSASTTSSAPSTPGFTTFCPLSSKVWITNSSPPQAQTPSRRFQHDSFKEGAGERGLEFASSHPLGEILRTQTSRSPFTEVPEQLKILHFSSISGLEHSFTCFSYCEGICFFHLHLLRSLILISHYF